MKSKTHTYIAPETKYVECIMGHKCDEKIYKVFGCSKCQRREYELMKHDTMKVGNVYDNYELWQ